MKKQEYEELNIEVIIFDDNDVIVTSNSEPEQGAHDGVIV